MSTQILKPVHDDGCAMNECGFGSRFGASVLLLSLKMAEQRNFHFFARNLKYSIGKKVEKIMAPTCFIESR